LMSFLAMSAAQLKFDAFDHIWHIYTPEKLKDEVKNGKRMHVPLSAGVRLIEVPFFTLGDYLLSAASTTTTDDVQTAEYTQKEHMDAQERKRCDHVVSKATRRQLDVLKAFARGLRPQEVANELVINIKTVYSHKEALLNLCSEVWELPDDRSFAYRFLQQKFSKYF
ncbi:MAG TPA: CRISPR-associated ring nuclease, partial [Methylomirabilota bacterium]|nr:CRISPR-associated ring nuclease [Methylomirabilota bacterium]